MGFFDFFFKKTINTSNTTATNPFDFLGKNNQSANHQWIIYWSDYNNEQGIGGYRKEGNGKVVLYNNIENKIAFETELQRPNSGNVANNGVVSISDWHFGDGMVGTFYVFSQDGSILLMRKFEANIISSGLSDDGQFAICQTAFSKSIDSSILTLFDIVNKKIIFSVKLEIEFGHKYIFDIQNKNIGIDINEIGIIDCDFDGNIIDIQKYHRKCLDSNKSQTVINSAEFLLKQNNDNDTIQKIIDALMRVSSDNYLNDNNKARILKLRAISLELFMNYTEALKLYKEALALNPNIGVKKKITALEKNYSKIQTP